MLFPTTSSPAFAWHLQTDTLLFCTSALAMLGMREDTAPATMEALLEHVPPRQRRFLRQQRAVLRSGGRLPGAACAYVCNGRDVNEHMHVLRRDDDDRPQVILACLELLDPPASLPEDVEDGYWSYTRGQAMPFLDMRWGWARRPVRWTGRGCAVCMAVTGWPGCSPDCGAGWTPATTQSACVWC